MIFPDSAEFSVEEYYEYVNFDCPVPENSAFVYTGSDMDLPDIDQIERDSKFDLAMEIVTPELDESEAEAWAKGQISVFLDDFLAGEEAKNTLYPKYIKNISKDALNAAIACCYPKELIVLDDENSQIPVGLVVLDGDSDSDSVKGVSEKSDSDVSESEDELFETINTYFRHFYMKVRYTMTVRERMRR